MRNYRLLPGDPRFVNSLWVQAKLSFWGVLFQVLLGMLLALLLHTQSRFVEFARTFFLIPMVLPPIVVAVIWKLIYTPDISPLYYAAGLLHLAMPSLTSSVDFALIAIIIADTWEWLPFTFLMVLAALQTIPEEFSEAALVDGANRLQIFYYVTLPFITPILVISAMFRLIDSVKAFPLIFLLTGGGPGSLTEVTNYYAYLLAFDTNEIGYSSAVTVVMLLLVAAVSLGLVWMGAIGRLWHERRLWPARGTGATSRSRWSVRRAAAVPVAVADELQVQRPDPAIPAAVDLQADARKLHLALAERVLGIVRQQPVERVVLDRLRLVARGSRGLCAVEMGGRGKQALSFAILVTRMAPPIAFTIPFFLFYRWIGLLDTITGLVLVYTSFNLPLVIWMMQPFFETVPVSLEEAALVDGAPIRTVFLKNRIADGGARHRRHRDPVLSLCLERFLLRVDPDPDQCAHAPVAVVNFMNYEGWEWGKIAAGGSLVMAPVLIFSLAVRRYLVSGLTAGAVKG